MDEKTLDPAEYVDQTASIVDLPINPQHRPGVVENFARLMVIAQLINEFPLPVEIEAAPAFKP